MNAEIYAWLGHPSPAVQPPVGSSRRNFYGACGMHGLVWEWVDDFNSILAPDPDQGQVCGAASLGASDPGDYASFMRRALLSSLRGCNSTGSLGFRCAADVPFQSPQTP